MRVGARLTGTELTFFSHLGATGWAPHYEGLFFGDFHNPIMRVYGSGRMVNFDHNRSQCVPGTNKRVARPRPRSEWRTSDRPDLRIVSEELGQVLQGEGRQLG